MLEPIRTQTLGSLLMKLSQSNFNLWLPDCYWVRSYLITTVTLSTRNIKILNRPLQYVQTFQIINLPIWSSKATLRTFWHSRKFGR